MSFSIEVASDGVRLPLPRARVAAIARAVLRAECARDARISVTFVSTRRIASLNWKHLRHRGATDVISFGLASDVRGAAPMGDIYIASDVARRNALLHGVSPSEELTRLVIHGVLHVLGYDHPEGRGRTESPMWERQEALLHAVQRRVRRRTASAA